MSRCFPFPPPGYERKHVPEDLDVMKEAKRKEKKHKKEEKERKKEKEKGKDKSDEKQKDKKERKKHKDKKDKHKDKKSKEDQSKDKEKSSISEESTVSGVKLEDKLHPEGHSKDKGNVVDERKHSALFQGQNGQRPSQSSVSSKGNNEIKFVQELDRRIRDDGARGSQLPSLVDDRDQRVAAKAAVENSSALLANEKGKEKSKKVDGIPKIGNLSNGKAGIEVDRIVGPDGKSNGGLEVKEKLKEAGEAKVGEKRKDRDKKSHGKEKSKEKEKNKKEKLKTENKKSKEVKLGEVGGNAFVSVSSGNKSTGSSKDVNNIGELHEENLRKRKDVGINGFCQEMETTANKIQRHAPPQQSIEIGRKLEACRTPIISYDEHTVPNSVSTDGKSGLINGIIKCKEPFPSVLQNSSAVISQEPVPALPSLPANPVPALPKIPKSKSISLKAKPIVPNIEDLIAEALKRPPHPDSKYLSEVLTVPNVPGLSEDGAEDWLFTKKDSLDKPKDESIRLNKETRVWSEAVRIESADICALPFVIPY